MSIYHNNSYGTLYSGRYLQPSAYTPSYGMTRNSSTTSSGSGGSYYGSPSDTSASSPPSYPPSPYPVEFQYAGSAGASKPKQPRTKQPATNGPPPAYHCLYPNCDHISGRSFDLERHMKKHNPIPPEQKYDCPGKGCGRVGAYGFDRRDHLTEHLRNYHAWDIPKGKSWNPNAAGGSGAGSGRRGRS